LLLYRWRSLRWSFAETKHESIHSSSAALCRKLLHQPLVSTSLSPLTVKSDPLVEVDFEIGHPQNIMILTPFCWLRSFEWRFDILISFVLCHLSPLRLPKFLTPATATGTTRSRLRMKDWSSPLCSGWTSRTMILTIAPLSFAHSNARLFADFGLSKEMLRLKMTFLGWLSASYSLGWRPSLSSIGSQSSSVITVSCSIAAFCTAPSYFFWSRSFQCGKPRHCHYCLGFL